ncbi:MAG: WhiB family transcriptional regulator [Caulobacteraceae bacterium]|nr:WhiB family transcriptional regulator [Caulobacteraceae bacterium]
MRNHRQKQTIQQKLFELHEIVIKEGQVPCQNAPDLFFPENTALAVEDTRYAKSLCGECPIIDECRMYALEAEEPYGIWGGLTPEERRSFRRTISSRNLTLPFQ